MSQDRKCVSGVKSVLLCVTGFGLTRTLPFGESQWNETVPLCSAAPVHPSLYTEDWICIEKKRRVGEVLEKMDFLAVPSWLVVCVYRSRQPLLHPHTGRNLECTQKKQVFIAILWFIFKEQHYSYLMSTCWEQVTASQGSSNERSCCRFSCKLQSTTNSLIWDKLCCEGRTGR